MIIKKMLKNKLAPLAILFLFAPKAMKAQEQLNVVHTSVPSLNISPDARAAGMGDIGVATTPDAYSQYWNPSKYAFMDTKAGISFSYTPWLSKPVNDIALMQMTGFYKLGTDENQAISASLRYFTLGKLETFDELGESMGEAHPNEFAVDLGYSRQLSENFSMAVALRYIRSDQSTHNTGENQAGNAFAADIAGYLQKYVLLGNAESLWSLGFNVKNIGTKISYDGGVTSFFIPTSLNLGTGLLYPIDDYNSINFNLELSKLLVPTPPIMDQNDQAGYEAALKKYQETSSISGIFSSFGDAPGGLKEEFREITWGLGAEYSYDDKFFVRAGYSYLHPTKGNLQYFTAGAGFKMNIFRIDASYLLSTIQSNPLDQTLRFTLAFDMDGLRNLFH
ncbi:type IX secretion system outer membrane channel protein PorV [Porphyromonas gingivalis]|uniref:type IX secretion system outer membrane channel protein PorV n=1 Tax=Porphyromonas gingivalis TaxID=837 RepID=UPI0004E7F13D|nr:type IX secretion system outer membrane channel protein PorV [Porphyromonas gingivalis]AIJ34959.1 membrane protein [Porphyromonas gingivalis]